MNAYLFGAHEVKIDPRCLQVGGSWQDARRDGQPATRCAELLQFFYNQLAQYKHPTFLDIGASTGCFALLTTLHTEATAIAFEPNPVVAEILRQNLQLNCVDSQVSVEPYALADYTGTAILKCPVAEGHSGMACLGEPQRFNQWAIWGGWTETLVSVRTLDSFQLPSVDIIKCDAEGSELSIFKGGEETIRRCMPQILFECYAPNTRQSGYEPEEVIALLTSWGYNVQQLWEEDAWAIPQ